jgi:hypothetical protein
MAGDWIKMRTELWTCPQVVRIASELSLPRAHIIGALHGVWSYFDIHSTDGTIAGLPNNLFDVLTETVGLEESLVGVGWLKNDGTSVTLPRYEDHNGPTGKRRAQDQKRKKRVRGLSADCPGEKRTRGEERRGEKKKKERRKKSAGDTPAPPVFDPLSTQLPEQLQTERFREAWAGWVQHRKEIRKKLTPTSVGQQIKTLGEMGESRAVECIRHTIEKGWTGLREAEGRDQPDETIDVDGGVEEMRREAAQQRAAAQAQPLGPMSDVVAAALKSPAE